MILLDTCALLWLAAYDDHLSATARESIRASAGGLFVSAISALEIGIKVRKGKLRLPQRADRWFPQALAAHGVTELPVTSAIALASAALPKLHDDPADRIIVATALAQGLLVLTPDAKLRAYPKLRSAW